MAIFLDVLPRLGLREAEAVVSQAKSLFAGAGKDIGASFGEGPAVAMKRMQEEYGRTAGVATETSRAMIRANAEVETSTKALGAATATYGAQAAETANAERALTEARIASLGATRTHNAAMNDAVAAQTAMTASTTSHGNAVAATGRVLNTVGIASVVGFTAAMVESSKMAGDFQASQMRLVSSAGESATNLKLVSDGILQLAGQVGFSAQELSKGMYTVESAGFRGADAIKVMTAAAQGAKAENADLTEVNNGLTTSLTDFHLGPDKAAEVMSKMVTAVGESKVTFQQFAGSLHSVEPAAAAAKISLEDVYGTLSRMTQSGMSADQATENMRNAINSLAAPNSQQAAAMAQFGVNADDVSQKLGERGLAGTMQYLSEAILRRMDPAGKISVSALNENAQAAQNATEMITKMSPAAAGVAQAYAAGTISRKEFTGAIKASNVEDASQLQQFGVLESKIEGFSKQFKGGRELTETYMNALKQLTGTVAGQSVALQVTGEHAQEANTAIQKIRDTTTDADGKVKGFNETQQTLNAKMADAKAAFGAAAIELGNVFIPTLTKVAEALANVGKFLAEHKALATDVTIAVGGIGAAWLITKGYMVFENIISGLGRMATAMFGVKAETLAVNDALRAQGPAAVTSAGAVEGAAASEKVALEGVATSALRVTGIVTALGFLIKDLWGNDISKWAHDNIPGVDANGMLGFNLTGAPRPQQLGLPDAAPGQSGPGQGGANPQRRIGAPAYVLPAAPPGLPPPDTSVPPPTTPPSTAPSTAPLTTPSAGNPKAPAGTKGDPVYTALPSPPPGAELNTGPAGQPGYYAPADPRKVREAEQKVTDAETRVHELEVKQSELKADAKESERLRLRDELDRAKREVRDARADLATAQQGKFTQSRGGGAGGGGPNGLFAPLAQDFGISGGLPGVTQWLVTLLGNMAIASIAGPLTGLGPGDIPGFGASSTFGVNASARGPAAWQPGGGSGGSGGYAGDAALLANVPAGRYSQTGSADLTKGLADCSSAVEDLVNIMDGRSTAGRGMSTGNAPQWLSAHGFMPGSAPGAFNVGFNSGHMQATLPGGTPFNWGSDAAAARGGVGGTGAFDPAFTSHYYRPVDPSTAVPVGPGFAAGGGVDTIPAMLSPGEHVLTAKDVAALGGQQGVYAFRNALHRQGGGEIKMAVPWGVDPIGGPDKSPSAGPFRPWWDMDWMPPEHPERVGPGEGRWWFHGPTHEKGITGGPLGPPIGRHRKPLPGDFYPGMFPDDRIKQWGASGFAGGGAVGYKENPPPPTPPPPPGALPGSPYAGAPNWPGQAGTTAPGAIGPFGVPPSVAAAAAPGGIGGSAGLGAGPSALRPPPPPPSLQPPGAPAPPSGPASLAPSAPPSGGGGGADGGGLIGAAAGMMPGGQVAAALATRAVKFGAQAAGILVGGALETFLPHDSPLADPGKSWFGKIAAGFSGARPATPNAAGQTPPPQNAQQQQQGQQQHKGTGAPPGPTNGVYIENMNNHGADGQGVASDIARAQYAQYQAGGPR